MRRFMSTAARPNVYFDVSIGGAAPQRIEFVLYSDVVPKVTKWPW
jgi:hypothetical protein